MSERDRNSMAADDPADAGLSRLYREAAQEAPPPHLDAAIRAAARREVGARPGRAGKFAANPWRLPLALAAVLVLSMSLVTLMMEEGGDELSAPPVPKAIAPMTGEPAASAKPSGAPPSESTPAEQAARKRETAPAAAPPARAPEPGVSGRAALQPRERSEPALASEAPAEAAAARPFPAAPAATAPVAPQAESFMQERLAAPERDAPAPPAARPRAAPADKLAVEESRPAAGALRRDAMANEAKRHSSLAALSPPVARQVRALEYEPPEKWLERIALLRSQGRNTEADELLAEFKRRFPGHPLPAPGAK